MPTFIQTSLDACKSANLQTMKCAQTKTTNKRSLQRNTPCFLGRDIHSNVQDYVTGMN